MTQSEFVDLLGRELRIRGKHFTRAELEAHVAGSWAWIEADSDVNRCVAEFADALAPKADD